MVPSLPLLSCESSKSVKGNSDEKKKNLEINVYKDIPTCRAPFIYSFISQEKDKKKYQKSK